MDLKLLEAQGFIEKASFAGGQITSNLSRAQRDLCTAQAPFLREFPEKFILAIEFGRNDGK
jgi:hypothetical protein